VKSNNSLNHYSMKRTCFECQSLIIGRTDKKFCSIDCKSSYHNNRNRVANSSIRRVNNTLRKNRRILKQCIDKNRTSVHRHKLIAVGFSFEYFTGQCQWNRKTLCQIYEYAYVFENDENISIYKVSEKPVELVRGNQENIVFFQKKRQVN